MKNLQNCVAVFNTLKMKELTFFTTTLCSLKDLTEYINKSNPLNYDIQFAHTFYEYKIKRFLTDVALGTTPSKVWTGTYNAYWRFLNC